MPQVQYSVGGSHTGIVMKLENKKKRKLSPRTKKNRRFNKKVRKIVANSFSNYNTVMPIYFSGTWFFNNGERKIWMPIEFLDATTLQSYVDKTEGTSTYSFGTANNSGTDTKDLLYKNRVHVKYFSGHMTVCQTGDDINNAPMRVMIYHFTYKSAIPTTNTIYGATCKTVTDVIANAAGIDVIAGPRPKLSTTVSIGGASKTDYYNSNRYVATDFYWLNKLVDFTKIETKYLKKGDSFDLDWKFYPKTPYDAWKKTAKDRLVIPGITHGFIITVENSIGAASAGDGKGTMSFQYWYKVGWKMEALQRPETIQKNPT